MKRILVVEDETSIRELVALNLKMAGWDVLEAPSAERALELMSPRPMDLPEGEEPRPLLEPSFTAMQGGLDELGMCQRLYRNAVELLDRP